MKLITFLSVVSLIALRFQASGGDKLVKKNVLSPDKTRGLFNYFFSVIHTEEYQRGYNKKAENSLLESEDTCRDEEILKLDCYAACFLRNTGIFGDLVYTEMISRLFFKLENEHVHRHVKVSGKNHSLHNLQLVKMDTRDTQSFNDIKHDSFSRTRRGADVDYYEKAEEVQVKAKYRGMKSFQAKFKDFGQYAKAQIKKQELHDKFENITLAYQNLSLSNPHDTVEPGNASMTSRAVVDLNESVLRKWLKMFFPGGDKNSKKSIQNIVRGFWKCVWRHPRALPIDYFGDCSGVQEILDCLVDVLMGDELGDDRTSRGHFSHKKLSHRHTEAHENFTYTSLNKDSQDKQNYSNQLIRTPTQPKDPKYREFTGTTNKPVQTPNPKDFKPFQAEMFQGKDYPQQNQRQESNLGTKKSEGPKNDKKQESDSNSSRKIP